jgi:hypothetical protein
MVTWGSPWHWAASSKPLLLRAAARALLLHAAANSHLEDEIVEDMQWICLRLFAQGWCGEK